MKLGVTKLSSAVRLALSLGAVIAVGASGTVFAQDTGAQDAANQPSQKKASTLETVVVTGSRVRRVDLETSSPVLTIDRAQIQASGKQTLGDLVQQIPAIAGAATNPSVNNGGGDGASTVSLRGLGSNRTLILVNGHRVLNNDINTIPASMVERIEVLKDGASATYGSDAIGGVVNFILRNDFQGAQISANYGESDHSDGAQRGFAATFGTSSDKGNIVAGIDYNKFDAISSANRDYSKYATYLYSGSVFNAGSSRNPNGRAFLSDANGGGTVTLANPVAGKTTRADYRPYNKLTDAYNYAAHNLIQTPQERTNVFALANYNLTDNVSAYFDAFYNKTTSNAALAALPFDANSDGVTISKDNYYNPFGQDFGPGTDAAGAPTAYNYVSRFTNLGQRVLHYSTTTGQVVAGLKGNFGADSSWQWFGDLNYGHQGTQQQSPGYVYYNGLKQALGPSFLDSDGVVKCGSAGNVIAGCTPVNIFNLNDPATTAALKNFAAAPFYHTLQTSRRVEVGANGSLFDLPAGTAQLAVGLSYDKEYQNYQVDLIAKTQGLDGTCFISQEACSTPLNGSFTDKEAYFELFVPVLADLPMVKSLNVTIGSRFSKYNTAGSSWNQKFGVEWRPIDDLLLRGTVAGVFRAPNINELYNGATGSAPQVTDPCLHLSAAELAQHAAACQFVPPGFAGSGNSQTTGVISGSVAAGYNLKPEHGKSYDYGFVYDPSFAPGLSISADLWRVTLDDTITPVAAQTVLTSCFQNESSPFCSLIHRNVSGDFSFISQPTVNLGKVNTKGIDGSIKYKIPHFDIAGQNWGDLTASLDATYLTRYDNDTAPGQPGDVIVHMAGHYNNQYGNYTRWRGLGQLNWTNGPWNVNYTVRYVGAVTTGWADLRENSSADIGFKGVELKSDAQIYNNLAFGYNLAAYHTRLDVGVNNLLDKQPPLMYQNNVLNANTDINTYEPIGRYFWGRVTVTF
ncbi:TonB-dependent receptor [Rhodanobacter sp. T12-5]|uniref:TonB-dependent receptor plug domain-containing protein n=1 Tax=Rhodanobacter sp. T12-5 TaxID=2024611 RepID=UPI0011F091DF|nr:TonB-dependent receptor [Rhodanobacter sp. T12-5]KAA0071816.1 TonB-dependent receptor [Rhodanobacter sp. T12-5]